MVKRRADLEVSAGGIVFRRDPDGTPRYLLIRDSYDNWGFPKGHLERGELPDAAAIREVTEETGLFGTSLGKLGDVRYVYTWAGERIFKVVSFYLVRYVAGRIGAIEPEMRREVAEARWLPLEEAPHLLAYKGEREMAAKALEAVDGL